MARRGFLGRAIGALAAGAAVNVTAIASSRPVLAVPADPIFALIDAHRRAYTESKNAVSAYNMIEAELDDAGDLFPAVLSRGNPYSGLPRPVSRTHAEIDMYSPADIYHDDNKREHAELEAAMECRDARQLPAEEAMDRAWDAEIRAIADLVETSPTTLKGVMALLAYEQDELWEHRRDMVVAGHLDVLCCSIRTALEALNPSA
jgi:hypothetical protein